MSGERCEHCGQPDEYEAQHRACRLKAAFPAAYSQEGAIVNFDPDAIRRSMGWMRPVGTRSGIEFEWMAGEVWAHVRTQVGNVSSSWSWRVTGDEWDAVVDAIAAARATR